MERNSEKVFGGIEGGASCSKLVLINEKGQDLCWVEGPSANYLLLGLEECQKRLHEMILKAKVEAKLSKDYQLESLAFCLSGCEQEEGNRQFETAYLRTYPEDTKTCVVASDTVGSVLTADPHGGLVLIAGTGSNSLLINPDGSTERCGGWGHLLGDEASAIWISLKACKYVFDTEDNYEVAPYSIDCLKKSILDHFQLEDKFGLLDHCYTNFNKMIFAKLCEKLAGVAIATNDPLIKHVFYEAGEALGKYVSALIPKANKSLVNSENGLSIVCVGSVFNSWCFLKDGFHAGLDPSLKKFSLLRLTKSSALGAALLGASKVGQEIPLDFSTHSTIIYKYPE